jgi:hypothetical protein
MGRRFGGVAHPWVNRASLWRQRARATKCDPGSNVPDRKSGPRGSQMFFWAVLITKRGKVTRYSQLYIERRLPQADSTRARIRLHGVFDREVGGEALKSGAWSKVKEVIGVEVTSWHQFFLRAEVRDLLDAVTEIANVLSVHRTSGSRPERWLAAANRIFQEENLAYRVGEDGIVHPFVDEEFEVNRASALEVLSDPRFGEVRTDFEAAHRHLRDGHGKEALRMMFPAVEVAAKVLFPGTLSRLMPNEVDRCLKPRLEKRYAGNDTAMNAGRLLLEGLKDWINAAQLYRHGQEQQDPAEPPMDFVIAHLSVGASYLRWMIELCSEARV